MNFPEGKFEILAKIGFWRYRQGDDSVQWSVGTYNLHELSPLENVDLATAINFYAASCKERVGQTIKRALEEVSEFTFDADIITSSGKLRRVRSFGAAEIDDGIAEISGVILDITEQYDSELNSAWNGARDSLTGLRNRRSFYDVVSDKLTNGAGDGWLALCDFDNMKPINDGYGHAVGDAALRRAANTMRKNLPFVELGRIGGDEFAMFFPGKTSVQIACRFLRQLIKDLKTPGCSDDPNISIPCTIGLTRCGEGDTIDSAMRRADIALYNGKAAGKGLVTVYTDMLQDPFAAKAEQMTVLAAAISSGRLRTAFQPIHSTDDPATLRFEALARVVNGDKILSPADFHAGLLDPDLSLAILEHSIADCVKVREEFGSHPVFHINCSPANLLLSGFCKKTANLIRRNGLQVDRFVLELTENGSFFDPNSALFAALQELRAAGFGVALDDFGTGQSSLTHISHLPITCLKIDKSFVSNVTSDKNLAVISALTSISRQLNLELIGEGVEDVGTEALLKSVGVRMMQGYLFGRPKIHVGASNLPGMIDAAA